MASAVPPSVRWSTAGVAGALASGHMVVVWAETGQPREPSRRAARTLCAELLQAVRPLPCKVSRSAADGVAVVALSARYEIGADVETSLAVDAGEFEALLHASEHVEWPPAPELPTLLRHLWCRKEAALKAFGVGLSVAPERCAVGPPSSTWQAVVIDGLGCARVRSIDIPFDAALAVAVLGTHAPESAIFMA